MLRMFGVALAVFLFLISFRRRDIRKWQALPSVSAAAPAAAACDSDTERGRFAMDATLNLMYVCNGAMRGWD